MKKLMTQFTCFLFFTTCWAQQDSLSKIDVRYSYMVRGNATKQVTYRNDYDLIVLPDYQVSVFDEKFNDFNQKEDSNNGIISWRPKGKNLATVYKNFGTNEMFLKDNINMRFFVQKDSLNIFNWEIKEDTKIILDYPCQLAVTTFRGRSYEAWFTALLPDAGPWKFGDLPGMILSIKSTDDFVLWEAVGIQIINVGSDYKKPENPFQLDKSLSWSEFKALYKEKAIAASKFTTMQGEAYNIVTPRMQIQRYIEEDDKDYTADKALEKKSK